MTIQLGHLVHFGLYGLTAQSLGIPTSTSTIGGGMANAVKLLMSVMGGLALIFILVGGLQIALSAGDSKRLAQGKSTLTYAIVGLVIAIAAYAIVSAIESGITTGLQ